MRSVLWGVGGLLLAASLAGAPARAEGHGDGAVGTSCADCPSYRGAFSIANATGNVIHYQVRWGNRHAWQRMDLETGHTKTHSYPLGEDRSAKVPTPYVQWDNVSDGNRTTMMEVRMGFHAVGYAGYGPAVNRTEPKPYHFRVAGDGRHIVLEAD